MHRLALCLVAAIALTLVPTALADGQPIPVNTGGTGVASHARPGLHYVTVPDGRGGTLLEEIERAPIGVSGWTRLRGAWGIPSIGYTAAAGQGLSRDGRTLVLQSLQGPWVSPSRFLVVDAKKMRVRRPITLRGSFSFDAISPHGSKLYFIEYASTQNQSSYVVRAYDMRTNRLLPGKIADVTEHEASMAGTPITRTTSADGRWVYTLYQRPDFGSIFVHALDTVGSVAHCIDLPTTTGVYNVVLSVRNGGQTLVADWRSGRPWLSVDTGSWQVSFPRAGAPWRWIGAGIGGVLAVLAAAALLLRRRRGEKVEQRTRQELGLA
jgi:hypothetical protein